MAVGNNKKSGRPHAERRELTQQKIIGHGSKLFGKQGFEQTSINQVARAAGLTEGAIYHHYGNKINLFNAVVEHREMLLTQDLAASDSIKDFGALMSMWDVFLQACKDPHFVQILLVDAPHVLGRDRWFKTSVLKQLDESLFESGLIKSMGLSEEDKTLLFHMLTAAVAEAALMIAKNPDYDAKPLLKKLMNIMAA